MPIRAPAEGVPLSATSVIEVPHPLLTEAEAWLRSADAYRCARRHTGNADLGLNPDELVAETRDRLWRYVRRNPDAAVPESVAAYCARTMRNVAVDHLRRSPINRRSVDPDRRPEPVAPPLVEPGGGDLGDRVRGLLETSGAEPAVVAAALAYVTLAEHPDVDLGALPAPRAGAHEHDARLWPALWVAGERSCLPGADRLDGVATRRRRSRRMRAVKDLLGDTARALGVRTR